MPLLARFGKDAVTIKRLTRTGYDAEEGAFDTITPTEEVVDGVVSEFDQSDVDGTRIRRDDKRVIFAGNVTLPTTQDRLIIGGVEMEIVRVTPHNPAGTLVAFEVQARA